MIVSLAQSYSISIPVEIQLVSGIAFPFEEFTVNFLNMLNILNFLEYMLSVSTILTFHGLIQLIQL